MMDCSACIKKKKKNANGERCPCGSFSAYRGSGGGDVSLAPQDGSAGETISQIIAPGPLQREPSGRSVTRMTAASATKKKKKEKKPAFSAGVWARPRLAPGSNPVSDIHEKESGECESGDGSVLEAAKLHLQFFFPPDPPTPPPSPPHQSGSKGDVHCLGGGVGWGGGLESTCLGFC